MRTAQGRNHNSPLIVHCLATGGRANMGGLVSTCTGGCQIPVNRHLSDLDPHALRLHTGG